MQELMGNILITGGYGSLGKAIQRRFINDKSVRFISFSRDEAKHWNARNEFPNSISYIGDIRDKDALNDAIARYQPNTIIHAAALKIINTAEDHVFEAVQTNIIGTKNVIDTAINNNVGSVCFLSSDKGTSCCTAYGATKQLGEALIRQYDSYSSTKFVSVRYGNIIASNLSILSYWVDMVKNGEALSVTDPNMTRFMLKLDDAIDLVLYAINEGKGGHTYVKKASACTIDTIIRALEKYYDKKIERNIVGVRSQEKFHEDLLNNAELVSGSDIECTDNIFDVPPNIIGDGSNQFFNSANAYQLNVDETIKLLLEAGVLN